MTAAGTRLSLGGRQPAVVDPANGSMRRIAPGADQGVSLFRQGSFTVLVADGRAWAVPAGRAGPQWLLGQARQALPASGGGPHLAGRHPLRPTRAELRPGRGGPGRRAPARPLDAPLPGRAGRGPALGGARQRPRRRPGAGRAGQRPRAHAARPRASFLDVHGDRVAWLAGGLLYVRDLRGGAATVVPPPPASAGWYGSGKPVSWAGCCYGLGAFAPDGRWLAVYTHLAGPRSPGLAIVDLAGAEPCCCPGPKT